MRRSAVVFAALCGVLVLARTGTAQQPPAGGQGGRGAGGGTVIQPGESCPAGTTEIRPRRCRAP